MRILISSMSLPLSQCRKKRDAEAKNEKGGRKRKKRQNKVDETGMKVTKYDARFNDGSRQVTPVAAVEKAAQRAAAAL